MTFWRIIDNRHLDRPEDWSTRFDRAAPLIVEVGFGRGDHLLHLAEQNPDANVLGIEISQPSLKKASRKVRTRQATNVRLIDGGAQSILWQNIAPATVAELHINFPDPWYKAAHHRRRLINDDFLQLAATRMKPGGKLFIASDHPDYQPVIGDHLQRSPHFDSRLPSVYTTDPGDRFQTKYELKALAEGRCPFYYLYVRNEQAAENIFTVDKELPMPHAIVALPLDIDAVEAAFDPFEEAVDDADTVVGYKQLFRSTEWPTLLVDTYIRQEPHDQRLALTIHQREKGEYIVQINNIGFPRATEGAHIAVGRLAGWLSRLDDSGAIIHHNLQPPP